MAKGVKIGLGILVVLIIVYFGATRYVTYRVTKFIEKDFLTTEVSVESVSTNLLTGSISVQGITTVSKNSSTSQVGLFEIIGLSYYEILFNNHISIEKVQITDFDVFLPLEQQTSSGKSTDRKVTLQQVSLNKGMIVKSDKNTTSFRVNGLEAYVQNTTFSTSNFNESLEYEIKNIQADSSFVKMNNSEDLKTGEIIVNSNQAEIQSLMIKTNTEITKQIKNDKINKDQMALKTSEISITAYELSTYPELLFRADKISIDSTSFSINANNNIERTETTTSYSEQLREMGLKLDISTIEVSNANVSYSEPNAAATKRGAISFENIDATFSNFNNIEGKGAITAQTSSSFMGSRNLTTDFSLNPYDVDDAFEWSGKMDGFNLTSINSFLTPVLAMKLKGIVHQYYFSIYGNNSTHTADIKIRFDDVQMEFAKDKLGINALISDLANLLVTNDSDNKLMSQSVTLERNTKASFFNQAWRVQRKALFEVVK
jgi:hypothetical protein